MTNEPSSLVAYRSTPSANYNSANKKDIREALIREQGAICAYCMQRISDDWNSNLNKYKVEIEHYISQNRDPGKALNYNNMLAVCNGNTSHHGQLHCDKSKGHKKITVNPLDRSTLSTVYYDKNGKIGARDSNIHKDLVDTLNLNEQNLQNARKEQLYVVIEFLIRKHGGKKTVCWKKSVIQSLINKWEAKKDGKYKPYSEFIIYHLRKYLRNAGS